MRPELQASLEEWVPLSWVQVLVAAPEVQTGQALAQAVREQELPLPP